MRSNLSWVTTGATGRLAIMPRPRAGDWLEDEVRGWREAGVQVVVSLLTEDEVRELGLEAEEEACRLAGLGFRAFPIPDRTVPDDAASFVRALRDELAAGRSIAIHCRMGIGRSSIIAGAVLVLLGLPADEALRRISIARGLEVPDTEEQRQWVLQFTG